MPSSVFSGVGGAVSGVGGIREWSVSRTSTLAEYVSSASLGAKGRLCAIQDWSGQFVASTYNTAWFPGKTVTFTGAGSSGGVSGSAIVDALEVTFDVDGLKPVEYTYRFSGNGALTLSGSASDATTPAEVCPADLVVSFDGTAVDDVRTVTISITAANVEYASSSTAGWKQRKAGPLDGTFSLSRYLDSLASIPAPGTLLALTVESGEDTLAEIEWFKITDASDVKVSPATAEIVGCTINGAFTGFDDSDSFATGQITFGSTTEWPPS